MVGLVADDVLASIERFCLENAPVQVKSPYSEPVSEGYCTRGGCMIHRVSFK